MKIDRSGEINTNKYNTKMIIIEYNNNRDVLVKFLDEHGYTVRCQYKNFKEDYIKKVADDYRKLIPDKLYKAMYNYTISIRD